MTPSVKEALKVKRRAEEYKVDEQAKVSKQYSEEMDVRSKVAEHKKATAKAKASRQAQQGEGDRAGVKVSNITSRRDSLRCYVMLTVLAPWLDHQLTSDPPNTTR